MVIFLPVMHRIALQCLTCSLEQLPISDILSSTPPLHSPPSPPQKKEKVYGGAADVWMTPVKENGRTNSEALFYQNITSFTSSWGMDGEKADSSLLSEDCHCWTRDGKWFSGFTNLKSRCSWASSHINKFLEDSDQIPGFFKAAEMYSFLTVQLKRNFTLTYTESWLWAFSERAPRSSFQLLQIARHSGYSVTSHSFSPEFVSHSSITESNCKPKEWRRIGRVGMGCVCVCVKPFKLSAAQSAHLNHWHRITVLYIKPQKTNHH